MARWEQYEVWTHDHGKWNLIASFNDFDVASTVARNHSSRMRLIRAIYEDRKLVSQDVLAELGTVREPGS